jgi:hypothetical protein
MLKSSGDNVGKTNSRIPFSSQAFSDQHWTPLFQCAITAVVEPGGAASHVGIVDCIEGN